MLNGHRSLLRLPSKLTSFAIEAYSEFFAAQPWMSRHMCKEVVWVLISITLRYYFVLVFTLFQV